MDLDIVEKQDVSCTDVFKCFFNLNNIDLIVFKHLCEKGSMRSEELEEATGKNQSTIFRSLQKLVSCRMVNKEKNTIERGGYFYIYSAVDCDLLQKRMKDCLDNWYGQMSTAIDEMDPNAYSIGDLEKH